MELAAAEEYLKLAKTLGSAPEIDIADAFIISQKGNKRDALGSLAGIDLPISRSAALMVVAHHEDPQGTVDWMKSAGIDAKSLDPDGKYFLLTLHFRISHWGKALELLDYFTEDDFRESPVLHHMTAMTYLLSAVPAELRAIVLNQIPFEAASFPLASTAAAISARKRAQHHFVEAGKVARQLNFFEAARIDDEYGLWLELRDPDNSNAGRQHLKAMLRDPKSALRLVHLGLQFGIKLELEAVEREIEQQVALHGGMTHDAAMARFALAFTQKNSEAIAKYISQHCVELSEHIDKKTLQFFQIEMFAQAGLVERANESLLSLVEKGISETEEGRLRRIIAEAEGTDPIEARKEQFKNTNSLSDLVNLIDELESNGEWADLCEYGEILFSRTLSLHDAERLSKALTNAHKNERLLSFLKNNETLLTQSKNLRMLYCWALYYDGALLEARSELAKLSDESDNPNFRALLVNLGIAIGDWNSLSAFVAAEYRNKDNRSAQDLFRVAQLALHLDSPNAKDLLFAAARKGGDDANILAAAYFLASTAGWEDYEEVYQWLNKSTMLSGGDGPIQRVSLKDLLDRKPEWERRESEIWKQWGRGEIPMFVASDLLNKSLVELMMFPALSNLSEIDPRRRGAIAAFSGKRQPIHSKISGVIGIEATALLTLSFLDILDKALDVFDTVYVPHETLSWLFEEKQKAAFHQPSRIRDAHRLNHLITTNALERLLPSTVPDSDLSAQIGETLAQLIAEAEKTSNDNQIQRIVVRSSPVHRSASLTDDEADLEAHAAVLSSCQAIVDRLREKGQITAEEEKKARSYLQFNEKPWPNQPEISDGAILYLDDLAITYFLHIGVLSKLKAAGFRPITTSRKADESNNLISYESISSEVNDIIERIRHTISSRIETGNIKVGKRIGTENKAERSLSEHPTLGITYLASLCDAIIVDDRFLNQHAHFKYKSGLTPIFSTIDLIDALESAGSITPENRLEFRSLLRRAGYFFIPVDHYELETHIFLSTIKNEKVVETAELKAIRENIHRVRMSTWLQIPNEAPWLDLLLKIFIKVLKGLWQANADLDAVRVRSDWILEQIDARGWAHRLVDENRDNFVKIGRGAFILLLISPPSDVPPEIVKEYWSWIEDRILIPIKKQYQDLYQWIIEMEIRQIDYVANADLPKGMTK